jgi:hypothetical protein
MKPQLKRRLVIKQPEAPSEEIAVSIIAEAIVAIADGITNLRNGPLNDKALLLLIQHAIPTRHRPTTQQISAVLEGIQDLKRQYIKR